MVLGHDGTDVYDGHRGWKGLLYAARSSGDVARPYFQD